MNYETCSDETLLLMSRSQNADAFYTLTKRYFDRRKNLCNQASAALAAMFDAWDLNHAFFLAFNSSLKSYSLGEGSFHAYLVRSLKNALIREAEKLHLFKNVKTLSLDREMGSDGMTLHDVIPANGEIDPKMYVTYLEEALRFGKVQDGLEEEVLQVARLKIDGCKFTEIGKILSISPKRASRDYDKYKELVKGIVFGS